MWSPNPYNYNLPVGPEMFFGRDGDVEALVRGLTGTPGDSFALVGGRRMGKTSLLEALKRALRPGSDRLIVAPVLLDMSGEAVDSARSFFDLIMEQATEVLGGEVGLPSGPSPAPDRVEPPKRALERWLRAMNRTAMEQQGRPLRLVLLLDECEQIVERPWTPDLYGALRSLLVGETTRALLKVVMAGSHRFLTQVRQRGSPLRNVLTYHYLRVLDAQATRDLIVRPTGGVLAEPVVRAVAGASGGHPFLTQYLMHHLWEEGLERATEETVRRIAADFPHRRGDFQTWMEGLGEGGRQVYALLARAGAPLGEDDIRAALPAPLPDLPQALEALCYHGVVVAEGAGYHVAGEMFRDWFLRDVPDADSSAREMAASPARETVPTGRETPAPPTARGVQIGGDVQGSIIITGDGNVVTVGAPSAARPPAGRGPVGVERAVLRIYAADGKSIVGAGFLVEGRHALTCDHVVAQALVGGEVRADFPLLAPGRILTARVVRRDSGADVAVLELVDTPPEQAAPVHLIAADDLWGHPFRAFGFPEGHPEGVWAAGVIRGPNARGWLQIEDTAGTGYRVQPGFSGTPVWDETLEGVVGMVVAAERDPAVRAAAIIPAGRLPVQCIPEGPRASNPFCDRGRINDPARLFDRERILRELRDLLAGGNSVSLVGEPQIGKSSVLYALYWTAGEWFPSGIVHYVDLQGVLDEADFCAEVLEGLGQKPGDLRALRRALRRQQVVLLLDEVEKLNRPAFSRDLHDLLRALAQEPTLTLAVASHRPLVEVFPPSSDTSPFHNIFTEKRLGPFSPAEARAFLHHRLQGTGVAFTAEEVEQLVMKSGGHPARLQELAYVLFEEKRR